jgi:hypothetical protein
MLLLAGLDGAYACACCTEIGQRYVGVQKLDSFRVEEIDKLRFADTAQLYIGVGDADDIKGIASPTGDYSLQAGWRNDMLELSFRDRKGNAGTLSLKRPPTISIFEVDTRVNRDKGLGPGLYKEWRIAAPAAGTGIFTPGLGPQQFIDLIFHGQGNSCTSASDFTHWTLEMRGPKATYRLFGELVR